LKRVRIIPVLTIDNEKLVKTVKFKNPNYIGDPINAVKIFNEKEVDEVVILDITATIQDREPNYQKIEEIASEAFMPFAYGGGIKNITQIEKLFKLGIEKVVINSALELNYDLITAAAKIFGSQSIVASIDVKSNIFKKLHTFTKSGSKKINKPLVEHLSKIEQAGVGEIFINSIDNDGTYLGYNYELIKLVSEHVSVPVVACGGASKITDFSKAIEAGASAAAAGSLFVYTGKTRGILINYPNQEVLSTEIYKNL
jgi:imidazole glycerol-phosphate synthase subunit HisF